MAGDVYIRFQLGSTGGSAAHLRYISRPAALRDGKEAVLLYNLPEAANEENLTLLRDHLFAYAWLREKAELRIDRAQIGNVRSYYRVTIGFEKSIETELARALIKEWLTTAFPNAQAAAFFHRDSPNFHAHIWIGAREISGLKIQIDYAQYRSLDETWNCIYSHAMGRALGEHVRKKDETRLEWRARHENHRDDGASHNRIDYQRDRSQFYAQELRNAGHHELEEIRTGRVEPALARSLTDSESGERSSSRRKSTTDRSVAVADQTEREAARAISEISALRSDASHLGSREALTKETEEQNHTLTRDR
jgi:hypothetical protein